MGRIRTNWRKAKGLRIAGDLSQHQSPGSRPQSQIDKARACNRNFFADRLQLTVGPQAVCDCLANLRWRHGQRLCKTQGNIACDITMFGLAGLIEALFDHGLIKLKRPAQAAR